MAFVIVLSSGRAALALEEIGTEAGSPCPAAPPVAAVPSPAPPEPPRLELNEVLPDPQGDDSAEFIEIVNRGSVDADATGWSIEDASEKRFVIQNARIAAGAPYSFIKSETKLAINNGGERLRLVSPSGTIVDETSFDATGHVGESFARDANGAWSWTIRPTPGSANVIESAEVAETSPSAMPEPIITEPIFSSVEPKKEDVIGIEPAPDDHEESGAAGEAVIVPVTEMPAGNGLAEYSGVVTVQPGRVSKATFLLLDDAGRGFVVRLYGKDGSSLRAGDHVTLRGRLHEDEERPWISVRKLDVVVTSNGGVRYERRDLATLSSDDHALPVEMKGVAVSVGERWIRIADDAGLGEIKATLPNDESFGAVDEGSEVTVKGIVRSTSQGLELVLLSRRHLTASARVIPTQETAAEPPAQAPANDTTEREPLVLGSVEKNEKRSNYAGFGLLGTAGILSILYWRKKKIPVT